MRVYELGVALTVKSWIVTSNEVAYVTEPLVPVMPTL